VKLRVGPGKPRIRRRGACRLNRVENPMKLPFPFMEPIEQMHSDDPPTEIFQDLPAQPLAVPGRVRRGKRPAVGLYAEQISPGAGILDRQIEPVSGKTQTPIDQETSVS